MSGSETDSQPKRGDGLVRRSIAMAVSLILVAGATPLRAPRMRRRGNARRRRVASELAMTIPLPAARTPHMNGANQSRRRGR